MAHSFIDPYKEQGARKKLIAFLRTERQVGDEAVLDAMLQVPRHYFFAKTFWHQAYKDIAFPIGEGQTISQPFTVAYQTQLLQVKKGDKVLEIGTGSGYQTCILLTLGASVYTIERIPVIYERTKNMLAKMGYQAHFYCGDGSQGLREQAPFDKILVTAGAPSVPEGLLKQLRVGGLLVIPVGDANEQYMTTVLRVSETEFEKITLDAFRFVPLLGSEAW